MAFRTEEPEDEFTGPASNVARVLRSFSILPCDFSMQLVFLNSIYNIAFS
jgi:hypothetical protein